MTVNKLLNASGNSCLSTENIIKCIFIRVKIEKLLGNGVVLFSYCRSNSNGSRIWSGGPNFELERMYIVSEAKQYKIYALTLGLGGLGFQAPLDPLLSNGQVVRHPHCQPLCIVCIISQS